MGFLGVVTFTLYSRGELLVQETFFQDIGYIDAYFYSVFGLVSTYHIMRSFAEWLEANFQWVTLNKLLSLGVAFFSAFTMFNWWLSYRLFTRSQVIKPKFRLL